MTAIEPHFRPARKLEWRLGKVRKSSPNRRASKAFCLRLPDGRDTCRGDMLRSANRYQRIAAIRLSRPQRTDLSP